MLQVGDLAPSFTLNDSDGQSVSLTDFRGQRSVILYFYPKDDTAGCTLEAQGFSAAQPDYDQLNATVLGISKDSEASHQKFCQKYGLHIRLLADPTHEVIDRYGAWQEKKMMGRTYMGTQRMTFLIDKEGIIRQIWPAVTPLGHEKQVLSSLRKLMTARQ